MFVVRCFDVSMFLCRNILQVLCTILEYFEDECGVWVGCVWVCGCIKNRKKEPSSFFLKSTLLPFSNSSLRRRRWRKSGVMGLVFQFPAEKVPIFRLVPHLWVGHMGIWATPPPRLLRFQIKCASTSALPFPSLPFASLAHKFLVSIDLHN
jgi:hypothetical protein